MSKFWILFKTLFKLQFSPKLKDAKARRNYRIAIGAIAVIYVILMAFVCAGIVSAAYSIKKVGGVDEMLMLIYIVGMTFVVIFGTIALISTLYQSRDVEFLSTLPVSPGVVFLVKLLIAYIYEALICAAVIFIPSLVLGIATSQGILYYLGALLALIIVPALPMLLTSLLAVPGMYVVSFFKSRKELGTILIILVFAAIMILYYLFIFSIQSGGGEVATDVEEALIGAFAQVDKFGIILFPLYMIAKFMTGVGVFGLQLAASIPLSLLMSIASIAALLAVVFFISKATYSRGVRAQLENRKTAVKTNGEFKFESIKSAIVKKDFKYLLRISTFGFQCLSGIVLCPVLGIALSIANSATSEMQLEELMMFNSIMSYMSYVIIFMMSGSLITAAATAFTREGKEYKILRTLPISAKEIVQAKIRLPIILSMVSIALGFVACMVMSLTRGIFNAVDFFGTLSISIAFSYFANHFAIYNDLKSPKLEWTAPMEAVKNNKNAMVPTFICLGITMLAFIGLLIMKVVLVGFEAVGLIFEANLISIIVYAVLLGIFILIGVLARNRLYNNAELLWQDASFR